MRSVAFVIPGIFRVGGAERQTILLAKGLCRRGWRTSVVALTGHGGAAAAELNEAGVGFTSLEMRKGLADPRGWIRFNRWLRRERPDVVHAHLPHAAWLARWSRCGAGIPVQLDTLHSVASGTAGQRLGYRLSNWLTSHVTAVSEAVAVAHLAAETATAKKLTVVPNGVDVVAWRPDGKVRAAMRSELGMREEFLWLAAGRLEPVKDYPTLLEAFARLPATARLAIAGGGALIGELLGAASQLGITRRVRFLGFVPDVERWMQAADGFVLSSRWEGLPMAALEAAACALPAAATDVGGVREVVVPGETGFLAPPGDQGALAAAMRRLMELSAEERAAMGQRARELVAGRYALERVLDRWEELYGSLLKDPGKR